MKCQSGLVFLVLLILVALSLPMVRGQRGNLPWGVKRIRGDLPWDKNADLMVDPDANAGQGIRVAVIDTGIANHPDLAGRLLEKHLHLCKESFFLRCFLGLIFHLFVCSNRKF